jgi:hypothetical protein
MEGCADEQQFSVELLSCLPSQLIGPEEDTMRVVEEQRRAELVEEPVASRVSCVSGTPGCSFWNFNAGVGTGKTIFGRRKVGRASAVCEGDLSNEFLFLIFESAAPIVISCIASFRNLLLKPHPRSAHAKLSASRAQP